MLTTVFPYEPNWKVESADRTAALFAATGGKVVAEPRDIPIGRVAVVEDPFGNVLVVLDSTRGTYHTDAEGNIVGIR